MIAQHLLQDRRYGWLTYLNGTFFIKRTPQDPHLYQFTRALPCQSIDITVLEMLACKCLCSTWSDNLHLGHRYLVEAFGLLLKEQGVYSRCVKTKELHLHALW